MKTLRGLRFRVENDPLLTEVERQFEACWRIWCMTGRVGSDTDKGEALTHFRAGWNAREIAGWSVEQRKGSPTS